MTYKAVQHKFTGSTTPISSYDETKTNLSSLMVQNSGTGAENNYAGPLPVAIDRVMQDAVTSTGTVTVSGTGVTGNGTSFVSTMGNMLMGFGSTSPSKITTWYTISSVGSGTSITLSSSAGTFGSGTTYVIVPNYALGMPSVITFSSTIDWVFLQENSSAATATRRIFMYEFNKTTATYTWIGHIIPTYPTTTPTMRGFEAYRYLHTSGTISSVVDGSVSGTGTLWATEKIAIGARIGFGSNDPTQISRWYNIITISSDTTIDTSEFVIESITPGTLYVIEELRFASTFVYGTATNGGLFLIKGINYSDFTKNGTAISTATSTDNQKAVYWLSDAGTTANVVTNTTPAGLCFGTELNKNLHYLYVLDGYGSTYVKIYRYNVRGTGTLSSGKMTMTISYYTTGTVGVSGTSVSGSGTSFTSAMIGRKIGFGSTSPANITTWYIISTVNSGTSITLTSSAGTIASNTPYIIDTADVICTAPQLVTGTVGGYNNLRSLTLNHGPGKNVESLYFTTGTRIYRAALDKIWSGNLGWISDNRAEIPPGSIYTYLLSSSFVSIDYDETTDCLIVPVNSYPGWRNYYTKYPNVSGDQMDLLFGIDDCQKDQALTDGNAYINNGTVAVSGTAVTGTKTSFAAEMVGFRIGFGSTDPASISTWYDISAYTSATSITLVSSAGTIGSGSAYVIDWNPGTFPHYNTGSKNNTSFTKNGFTHIIKMGTTVSDCQMYALPLAAHQSYTGTTGQRIITPKLLTPNCKSYRRVIVNDVKRFGSGEFAYTPEPYKLYYRTSGIKYNTGEWILVPKDGKLGGVNTAEAIQFMFEFFTIGIYCIPSRIMDVTLIYDDTGVQTDSHFEPSVAKSNATNKQFAWRFANTFGGTVPTLRVRLYDIETNALLLDDYSDNPKATWEKSIDGSTWGAYNTTDKSNENTYIRFTPPALGDNIKVRAILTQ